MLLAELSQHVKAVETKFLYNSWKQHRGAALTAKEEHSGAALTTKEEHSGAAKEDTTPLVQILVIVGNLAGALSKIAVQDIKGGCGFGCGLFLLYFVFR